MVEEGRGFEAKAALALRTGRIAGVDPGELTTACDRLVRAETQRSLPRAVRLSRKFVALARDHSEISLQIALRSSAWVSHCSGKYREAERSYLEARALVVKSPFDRAQIDKILIDVYMYLGRPSEARLRARQAIRTFQKLGELDQVAKTRINFGNLLHRQDRHRAARREYEAARDRLERGQGNELVLGLCYYNLANTLVQLFEFDEAKKFYEKARENFCRQHYDLFVNESDYGLAWLAVLNNDYHVALRLLYQCEEKYRQVHQPKGVLLCVLDRAEAYLGLNLFGDALDAAREAERRARKLKLSYESGKAAFFRARAAHALGRESEARRALERARRDFGRERNEEFLAAVRLFETGLLAGRPAEWSRVNKIRGRLNDRQLPLWAAISDLQLLAAAPDDTAARRRLSRNPAVRSVPHLLAQYRTMQGDRDFKRGAFESAMKHWTGAADVLDLVRAKLPPVELRATFARGRTEPYERIIAHLLDGHPAAASIWIDRLKTAGLWASSNEFFAAASGRSKAEESLYRLARQVSALAEQIGPVSGTRSGDPFAAHPAVRRLQREARDRLAMMDAGPRRITPWLRRFETELGRLSTRYPVVQLCLQGEDIVALVHLAGTTRLRRYRRARRTLPEWCGAWQVQLNRSLLSASGSTRADREDERRLFTRLGEFFWDPLELGSEHRRVLVVPHGMLAALPWAAFVSRGRTVCDDSSLIMSPSVQHHLYACTLGRGESARVGVFVGDRTNLAPARDEMSGLLRAFREVEMHDPCRRADWPIEGSWAVWHYTGHARYRSDNPFYSSLELHDGPLFGADFRLRRCRVDLVTLAACRTAHQSVSPGEEASGLVRCLLEMGSRNVVGSHWAVADRSATFWMQCFYESITNGEEVCDAVRTASLTVKEHFPSVYDWAAFSVQGAG